jgi:hypothetical protein
MISALWKARIAGISLWKGQYDAFVTPFHPGKCGIWGLCRGSTSWACSPARPELSTGTRARPPWRGKSGIVTFMMTKCYDAAPFHPKTKVNPHFYIRLYFRQIVENVIIVPAPRFWREGC